MRFLCYIVLIPSLAWCQDSGRSSVTVGIGGGFPAGGYRTDASHNGTWFSAHYEFRVHRFVAAEIGVDNFLRGYDNVARVDLPGSTERSTFLPIGLRAIAPLDKGRFELFAGTGGGYVWHSFYELRSLPGGNTWLWQVNAGGRVAIGRRFWAGPEVRLYRDLGRPTQEWVSLTGDFGYRFGR